MDQDLSQLQHVLNSVQARLYSLRAARAGLDEEGTEDTERESNLVANVAAKDATGTLKSAVVRNVRSAQAELREREAAVAHLLRAEAKLVEAEEKACAELVSMRKSVAAAEETRALVQKRVTSLRERLSKLKINQKELEASLRGLEQEIVKKETDEVLVRAAVLRSSRECARMRQSMKARREKSDVSGTATSIGHADGTSKGYAVAEEDEDIFEDLCY